MDKSGAAVFSEAGLDTWGRPPRNFTFDEPFLVMLLKRGARWPYLALWIENTDLFAPLSEDDYYTEYHDRLDKLDKRGDKE